MKEIARYFALHHIPLAEAGGIKIITAQREIGEPIASPVLFSLHLRSADLGRWIKPLIPVQSNFASQWRALQADGLYGLQVSRFPFDGSAWWPPAKASWPRIQVL